MLSLLQNLGPYIAIVSAILAAYFTYRNQLRLKTFELLYERRKAILIDIENYLGILYQLKSDLDDKSQSERVRKYLREHFYEGLILFHKIKGANFGNVPDIMAETFWTILQEPILKSEAMSLENAKSWVERTTNSLSILYGLSHRQLTREMEVMSMNFVQKYIRKFREWRLTPSKPNKEIDS